MGDCRHKHFPECKQGVQPSPDLVINQLLLDDNPALHVPLSFAQLALCAPQLSCQLSCISLKPAACNVLYDQYLNADVDELQVGHVAICLAEKSTALASVAVVCSTWTLRK